MQILWAFTVIIFGSMGAPANSPHPDLVGGSIEFRTTTLFTTESSCNDVRDETMDRIPEMEERFPNTSVVIEVTECEAIRFEKID